VRRFLPKYAAGLPAGLILLLSVLFLSLIQIVQMNTFSLEGRQRQFFVGSVAAVAVAFATAWAGSRVVGTLTAVAWSQVITAALWWVGNEWFLRRRTGVAWGDVLRVLAGFGVGVVAVYVASTTRTLTASGLLYYGITLIPIFLLFQTEARTALRSLKQR